MLGKQKSVDHDDSENKLHACCSVSSGMLFYPSLVSTGREKHSLQTEVKCLWKEKCGNDRFMDWEREELKLDSSNKILVKEDFDEESMDRKRSASKFLSTLSFTTFGSFSLCRLLCDVSLIRE
jgi:hypothetical protein